MVSTMWAGNQQFSPEFFEWQGRVWVLGYLSKVNTLDWTTPTAVYIYDIENNLYMQLTSTGAWKDPEVNVLNDGSLAFYADDTSKTEQLYDTISYDKAMRLGAVTEFYQNYVAASSLGVATAASTTANHVTAADLGPITLDVLKPIDTHVEAVQAQSALLSEAIQAVVVKAAAREDADSFVFHPRKADPDHARHGLRQASGLGDDGLSMLRGLQG